MHRPNILGLVAIASLALASTTNLLLYDIPVIYSIIFFGVPLVLGVYGILYKSRAFILSSAASLLLVSLRPDVGESFLILPFLVGFIIFIEAAEASIRLHDLKDEVMRKNYLAKGMTIVGGTIIFSLGIFYFTPQIPKLLGEAAGSAAILDTIQLPLIVGLVLLAALAVGSLALKN